MPDTTLFTDLKRSSYDLLRLSDAILNRRNLDRRNPGCDTCKETLPQNLLSLNHLSRAVRFTNSDLINLGIDRDGLRRFGFWPSQKNGLDRDEFDRTRVHTHPILFGPSEIIVALPTSIAWAIVMEIIDFCHGIEMTASLEAALAQYYTRFLTELPLLGGASGAPMRFQTIRRLSIANFGRKIDVGRSIHVLAVLDDFSRDGSGSLNKVTADPDTLGAVINEAVQHVRTQITARPSFRESQTLVVSCGWGRSIRFAAPPNDPSWPIEVVHAHDLDTLSRLPRMGPNKFWQTLSMARRLKSLGIEIQNPNGLLSYV